MDTNGIVSRNFSFFSILVDRLLCVRIFPVEISTYLSFDQMIRGFSLNILPLLRQTHTKINLIDPSNPLLEMISRHLDPRQIASLHLTDKFVRSDDGLRSFQTLNQLVNLTVFSDRDDGLIDRLLETLPNILTLTLLLDCPISPDLVSKLYSLDSHPITHLHIRCPGVFSTGFMSMLPSSSVLMNTKITSFIFDFEYGNPRKRFKLSEDHRRWGPTSLVKVVMLFIGSLVNVRRVRFITSRSRIGTLLQFDEWRDALRRCVHLDRVILQLVDDGNFTRQAENIADKLRQFRPRMIFRIEKV